MKKNTNLNLILYLTLSSVFFNFILLNNVSITYFPSIAFLIPLIMGVLSILLFIFLPKQKNEFIKHNTFVKLISFLYYIGLNILLLLLCTYVLNYYFYPKTNFLLLSTLFSLVILLISLYKTKHIYDISFTIFLFIFISNFILLFNTSYGDFDLLFNIRINTLFNNKWFLLLSLLFIQLDPICFYLNNIIEEKSNMRKSIIISTIISSAISCMTILINYLYYSSSYLSEAIFPSFSFISCLLGPEFLDYFTIIILINTLTYCLLKSSLNISLISSNYYSKSIINIITIAFVLFITNLIYQYEFLSFYQFKYLGITLSLILLIIYIWLVISKGGNKSAFTFNKR